MPGFINRSTPMKWLRFAELKARGIVNSWAMLGRRIERDGFPPGRMLGANTRAWSESEIEQWLNSRPLAGPAPRGAAKVKHEQRKEQAARPET
jgi:predicted DNA-binding transcriptional regulator AlpA